MGNRHRYLHSRQRIAILIDGLAVEVDGRLSASIMFRRPFSCLFEFLRIPLLENLSGTSDEQAGLDCGTLCNGRWINGRGNCWLSFHDRLDSDVATIAKKAQSKLRPRYYPRTGFHIDYFNPIWTSTWSQKTARLMLSERNSRAMTFVINAKTIRRSK